ncbi:hypothetical protein MKZ01_07765 [Lysinibacillus endophyticus]|nr:hypothetical protein [Lysinibacillus endophyticus]
MWVVTVFEKDTVRMFEFLSQKEANKKLASVKGSAILSFTK